MYIILQCPAVVSLAEKLLAYKMTWIFKPFNVYKPKLSERIKVRFHYQTGSMYVFIYLLTLMNLAIKSFIHIVSTSDWFQTFGYIYIYIH